MGTSDFSVLSEVSAPSKSNSWTVNLFPIASDAANSKKDYAKHKSGNGDFIITGILVYGKALANCDTEMTT